MFPYANVEKGSSHSLCNSLSIDVLLNSNSERLLELLLALPKPKNLDKSWCFAFNSDFYCYHFYRDYDDDGDYSLVVVSIKWAKSATCLNGSGGSSYRLPLECIGGVFACR